MEHETSTVKHFTKKFDGKSNLIIALGAVVVILVVVAVAQFGGASFFKFKKNISPDEAKTKAESFINANLVAAGTTATVTEVTDYNSSLYKLAVKVGDNTIESFMSKDGTQFFPQVMNIEQINNGGTDTAASSTPQAPVVPADLVKSDKPKVELFIMSHCPYGTQIEKGIVPVMKTLGKKADIQIKFVNYIMHGDAELQDNIRQYCIGTEQNAKYNDYLTCFLKAGDATGCMASTGIDQKKLDSCYKATDSKFKLTADFNDKTKWKGSFPTFAINDAENNSYGVQGSPTLVINGKQVESNRDSASLLSTICAAFNNQPDECKSKLDSASPSAGFGEGTAAAGSGSAAECAPAN